MPFSRVLSDVVRGLTNDETARLLGISPHTVGVSRRSELAFLVRSGAAANGKPANPRELLPQRRLVTTIAAADAPWCPPPTRAMTAAPGTTGRLAQR